MSDFKSQNNMGAKGAISINGRWVTSGSKARAQNESGNI